MTRTRIVLYCCIAMLLMYGHAFSQKLEKKMIKAESSFYLEKFDKARVEYEELVKLDPRYGTGKYRLEICSLLTVEPNKSLDLIKSYEKTQGRLDRFYWYWRALIHFKRKEYKESRDACDRFLVVNKYKTRLIRTEIDTLRRRANLIYRYHEQQKSYEIIHLQGKVNTKHNEFSPLFIDSRNSIMFVSSHRRFGGNPKNEVFHIFESSHDNDHWHHPKHIHHLGAYSGDFTSISISDDSGRLFVYSDYKGGELFFSEPKGHTWTVPKEYDEKIITSRVGSHFYINKSENRILYSKEVEIEDEENKITQLDILQSFKDPKKGIWSNPESISVVINSELDEDYPYMTDDENTLYFCSKGHESIGGYDIFKSEFNPIDESWSEPEILGYPFNTVKDELQFSLNSDLVTGYYVSNREGTLGGYDIYRFHELDKISVTGKVTNNQEEPWVKASVTLQKISEEEEQTPIKKYTTNEDGLFTAKVDAENKYRLKIYIDYELVHTDVLKSPVYNLEDPYYTVHYIPAETSDDSD